MVWYYKERKAVTARTSVVKVKVKLKLKAAGMEASPSQLSLEGKKMMNTTDNSQCQRE
jgi:hypothetical protein